MHKHIENKPYPHQQKNTRQSVFFRLVFIFIAGIVYPTCNQKAVLFDSLDAEKTNLFVANTLTPTKDWNAFEYMYFYNGGGLIAADFNNDQLIDLFFTTNQKGKQLFLNQGNLSFKNSTTKAQINHQEGWHTGASVVDINGDGYLDIYVCKVSNDSNNKVENEFWICNGTNKNGLPTYTNRAKEYGLNFSGYSTQAAFFDFDIDGDLDLFLLNHAPHYNGVYHTRQSYQKEFDPMSGDQFFENHQGQFLNKTKEVGIYSNSIGYGLGVCIADINLDGKSDIYIGNDFHENDYLYINTGQKIFTEVGEQQMGHTSKFSMGVDIADINNDAFPEIMTVDMQPEDPAMLRKSLGEDNYSIFNFKKQHGFSYQYPHNSLQWNTGNQQFFEAAYYGGIASSDWSWSPLLIDFNNDGYRDVFISNGIPKRLNDIDYINFIVNQQVQQNIVSKTLSSKEEQILNSFPEIKLKNKFYTYKGNMQFEELSDEIKNNPNTFSNSAVSADFDNDGDIDIVVNNINDNALLYENKTASNGVRPQHAIRLWSEVSDNHFAIGSKLILFTDKGKLTYQHNTNHGFQASSLLPFYVPSILKIDSAWLIWQDNSFEKISPDIFQKDTILVQLKPTEKFNYELLHTKKESVEWKQENKTGLEFIHHENSFSDFDREPLMPYLLSTETPFLIKGDINKDGLDDVYIGSSAGQNKMIFLQQAKGIFQKLSIPELNVATNKEDGAALFADINNDGFDDLIIAGGGNEQTLNSDNYRIRCYLNNQKNNFIEQQNAFNNIRINASTMCASDINGDGFIDIFIGSNSVPSEYGKIPSCYLFINQKNNSFKNETNKYNTKLEKISFINKAAFADLNKDNIPELILALQWGGIVYFEMHNQQLTQKKITSLHGFWNNFLVADIDEDGNMDLLASNLGLSHRLSKATPVQPLTMYVNDFDDNGQQETVLTYFLQNREITLFPKADIEKQIPKIKKNFLYAEKFSIASIEEILGKEKLEKSEKFTAYEFRSMLFLQQSNAFRPTPLPPETQLATMKTMSLIEGKNGLSNILLGGNFSYNNIPLERSDASSGIILNNQGQGKFIVERIHNDFFKGEIRQIARIHTAKKKYYAILKHRDTMQIVSPTTK